jgi:hypothetical protein
VTLTLPSSRHKQNTSTIKHSKGVGSLGRDVVLLTRRDGTPPAKALAAYDPFLARVATPLAFFSYGPAARPYMVVQLHRPAEYRWDEYTFLKPMELSPEPDALLVLPLSHLYDQLRPLPHFPKGARLPSKTTVHITVGFK